MKCVQLLLSWKKNAQLPTDTHQLNQPSFQNFAINIFICESRQVMNIVFTETFVFTFCFQNIIRESISQKESIYQTIDRTNIDCVAEKFGRRSSTDNFVRWDWPSVPPGQTDDRTKDCWKLSKTLIIAKSHTYRKKSHAVAKSHMPSQKVKPTPKWSQKVNHPWFFSFFKIKYLTFPLKHVNLFTHILDFNSELCKWWFSDESTEVAEIEKADISSHMMFLNYYFVDQVVDLRRINYLNSSTSSFLCKTINKAHFNLKNLLMPKLSHF